MIGSFLTRGLVMVFGYAYPAYECYKTVEQNRPDIEQLRFWCQYWILVAMLTVSERVGDTFISWVPMYMEAKLAFFIYLWYPKTKGTTYVYDSFFKPYVAKHETEIDRNLSELKTRAGDAAVLYFRKAACYGQTRIFEVLQFVASQSTPKPRPAQARTEGARARPAAAAAPNRKPHARSKSLNVEVQSPASSSTSSSDPEDEDYQLSAPLPKPAVPRSVAVLNAQKAKDAAKPPPAPAAAVAADPSTNQPNPKAPENMQIDSVSNESGNPNPPVQETVMEEAIRVTRGRLRRTRAAITKSKSLESSATSSTSSPI